VASVNAVPGISQETESAQFNKESPARGAIGRDINNRPLTFSLRGKRQRR